MKNHKLRYYLRGLGIGVLVTAFIIGIAGNGAGTMTDAQVRERALELGMVDADSIVLSELQRDETKEPETIVQESEIEVLPDAETMTGEETIEESVEEPIETSADEPTETLPEESVEASTETEHEYDTVIIESGSSSYDVSKMLFEAGLIESVQEFDTFLCENGYAKSIRVGTFKIPAYANQEDIAKIITGKR